MPERRINPGRRAEDQPKPAPKEPEPPRPEVEPNRDHFLHKKLGKKT